MSSPASTACPRPYPPGIENLTRAELAQLAANERCRKAVRADVRRRLKDTPNKANYLTFRWLTFGWPVPPDEEDGADAFDGLIACCWNATKIRNPSGLYPRGYPDTYCGARERLDGSIVQPAGCVADETRETIKDELAGQFHDLRTLSAPEIVLTALNGTAYSHRIP